MIRNLKVMGLALVAVFAFAAMSASAASAQNGKLTSTGPVTLDGTEIAGATNSFTAFGAEVKCPGSTITGHKYNVTPHELIPSGAETATLTPDIIQPNCVAIEGGTTHKATVTMNGCDYVLHIGETDTSKPDTYKTTVTVVCPAGKSIIVDVYFSASNENLKVCEITVGPQTPSGPPTLTDETNGHLTLNGTYTEIHASRSGVCGNSSEEHAQFHANFTITGTNAAGESTSISLSHA
jgi:hypothetical protein